MANLVINPLQKESFSICDKDYLEDKIEILGASASASCKMCSGLSQSQHQPATITAWLSLLCSSSSSLMFLSSALRELGFHLSLVFSHFLGRSSSLACNMLHKYFICGRRLTTHSVVSTHFLSHSRRYSAGVPNKGA